jgi:hypothetical protein
MMSVGDSLTKTVWSWPKRNSVLSLSGPRSAYPGALLQLDQLTGRVPFSPFFEGQKQPLLDIRCPHGVCEIGMPRARSGAAITTPRRRRVTPKEYRAAFAARVRHARTVARYPLDDMALLLGITRDTYAKYEGRGASSAAHFSPRVLSNSRA